MTRKAMRLRSRRSMRRTREGEEDCQGGHPRVGAGQQAEANLGLAGLLSASLRQRAEQIMDTSAREALITSLEEDWAVIGLEAPPYAHRLWMTRRAMRQRSRRSMRRTRRRRRRLSRRSPMSGGWSTSRSPSGVGVLDDVGILDDGPLTQR